MVEEYTHQVKEKERNPEADIMDAIHAAAYGNTGLGLSVQAPLGHLKSVRDQILDDDRCCSSNSHDLWESSRSLRHPRFVTS